MTSDGDWLFKERLLFGNPKSHICICSLWTPLEHIKQTIPNHLFCVCGNLYSSHGQGVATIARNILAHPHIRVIGIYNCVCL